MLEVGRVGRGSPVFESVVSLFENVRWRRSAYEVRKTEENGARVGEVEKESVV